MDYIELILTPILGMKLNALVTWYHTLA